MSSWRTSVSREPTEGECEAVALRYALSLGCSIPHAVALNAAEAAAWNACHPRESCDFSTDETLQWKWPALEAHSILSNDDQIDPIPVFWLEDLMKTRIRAWVVMTLSQFGPASRIEARRSSDMELARQRLNRAAAIDLDEFIISVERELQDGLGPAWRRDPAAHALAERVISWQRAEKQKTMQDLYGEISSFMEDVYTLQAEPCNECGLRGVKNHSIAPTEEALPPWHLSCSCEVRWEHEWKFDELPSSPNLDAAIKAWISRSVSGFSVQAPTLHELLEFERAKLHDK